MKMNLIICNILLILIGFCSCSNNSPSSKVKEIVLEQKYSIDNDGDIIEDGFIGDIEGVKKIAKEELSESDKGKSTPNLFIQLILVLAIPMIIAVIDIIILYEQKLFYFGVKLVAFSVLSGFILVAHEIYLVSLCIQISILIIFIVVSLRNIYMSNNDAEKSIPHYITCPICGDKLYIREGESTVLGINSSINVVWCPTCGFGNKPKSGNLHNFINFPGCIKVNNPSSINGSVELDRRFRLPKRFREICSNPERTISKRLYILVNDHICRFTTDYSNYKVYITDINTSEEMYEYTRYGVGFFINSYEKSNKSIKEVFDENYCGVYCSRGIDKCKEDNPDCLLNKVLTKEVDLDKKDISADDLRRKLHTEIRSLIEPNICEKKCPLQKGRSEVCNGDECVINKILNGL